MKNKQIITLVAIMVTIAGTISGFILSDIIQRVDSEKKPVVEISNQERLVGPEINIIYERAYEKCGHTVVSAFDQAQELQGRSIYQIRRSYSPDLGYNISWEENSMIIHQHINGFCPADQELYHLKEYQGMIAVYRGTEPEEVLERVTGINMGLLPASIQEDIRTGKFEFRDKAALNDVLENFDEYM